MKVGEEVKRVSWINGQDSSEKYTMKIQDDFVITSNIFYFKFYWNFYFNPILQANILCDNIVFPKF